MAARRRTLDRGDDTEEHFEVWEAGDPPRNSDEAREALIREYIESAPGIPNLALIDIDPAPRIAGPLRQGIEVGLLRLEADPETGERMVRNISGETVHTQGYAPPIAPGDVVYLSVRERIRRANEQRVRAIAQSIQEEEDRWVLEVLAKAHEDILLRQGYPTLWEHLEED